jgi:sodium/potassium/calcium exchanger 6
MKPSASKLLPRGRRRNIASLERASRVLIRVFAATLAVIALSCLYHYYLAEPLQGSAVRLQRRGAVQDDEEVSYIWLFTRRAHSPQKAPRLIRLQCHRVHHVQDKCAFVRANCADEEPGYIAYLQLYYCNFQNTKPVACAIGILWLSLLFGTIGLAASDFFCVNLSSIATLAGMSENFAGVTLLALGNGSPDVFSTFAAMYNNSGSLAIGELIGAAGFITAVVAGSMAFIRPFTVPKKTFLRDVIFFTVAAAFTLGFLADGNLYLWECIVMVLIYISYVCIVVVWHWHYKKLKRIRQTESAVRSHYIFGGTEAAELANGYHDEDEDRDPRDRTQRPNAEDFVALESGGANQYDEEEDLPDRFMAQISSQMRLRRPAQRDRRNTHDPIRPSLLGAIEFQSVLSGLHREGNLQAYPLYPRRYSDDPTLALSQDQRSTFSEPRLGDGIDELNATKRPLTNRTASGNRTRAASAAASAGAYTPKVQPPIPRIDLAPLDDEGHVDEQDGSAGRAGRRPDLLPPPSPTISISPPPSENALRDGNGYRVPDPLAGSLAIPGASGTRLLTANANMSRPDARSELTASDAFSQYPFPVYVDDSEAVISVGSGTQSPPPRVSQVSTPGQSSGLMDDGIIRPVPWWPYQVLPPPHSILSTLFPTLYRWTDKTVIGKVLAVFSAPSILLLTLTLPVVEVQNESGLEDMIPNLSLPPTVSSSLVFSDSRSEHRGRRSHAQAAARSKQITVTGSSSSSHEAFERMPMPVTAESNGYVDSPEQIPGVVADREVEVADWNRWLVMLQMVTAPYFCVVIAWANMDYGNIRMLLYASMGSLVFSCVTLVCVGVTTRPDRAPRWHGALCMLGFCVSIAWISTIAGEVVGVLKALGIIFNISDAILGLTVFAVGNSLGDLVADITVAQLGYPVMAFSACFGGPMLNILLGIGLSGAYMTVRGAQDRALKHPGKKFKFKPYVVEVDRTLMISGVALLVTLMGLLVVVPLRKWRMDRTVGYWLGGLWLLATGGNLVTEILMGRWGGHVGHVQ